MVYNGSLCHDVMTRWQQCANAVDDGIIRIQTLDSTIEATEEKISKLLNTSSNEAVYFEKSFVFVFFFWQTWSQLVVMTLPNHFFVS